MFGVGHAWLNVIYPENAYYSIRRWIKQLHLKGGIQLSYLICQRHFGEG